MDKEVKKELFLLWVALIILTIDCGFLAYKIHGVRTKQTIKIASRQYNEVDPAVMYELKKQVDSLDHRVNDLTVGSYFTAEQLRILKGKNGSIYK